MKAMLLAAGAGTRLRPYTDHVPKCMLPIAGKPLLEHTIMHLQQQGVTEIVINVCALPQVIMDHFGSGERWGVCIRYSVEATQLGTAGGVKRMADFFAGAPFLVWYGDNLSRCNVGQLYASHVARGSVATLALFHREDVSQSGIVGLGPEERIVRFLEKPQPDQVFSHWVNAGIYMLEPSVLDFIPAGAPVDFAREVFPALLAAGEPLHGYPLSAAEGLWWIDRPEDLQRVQAEWKENP